jgi:hypothetical protein
VRKLLWALAAIVIAALVLLWMQVDAPATSAAPRAVAATVPPAPVAAARSEEPAPSAAPPAASSAAPAGPAAPAGKLDPAGDEFFQQHDRIVVPMVMRQAVKCWENVPKARRKEFHRNQSMVVKFKQRIREGVVTIHDAVIERSSIRDSALEQCFLQQIRSTTWTNPRLPDYEQDDEVKLGPRTLKKYTRWNVEADETTNDDEF